MIKYRNKIEDIILNEGFLYLNDKNQQRIDIDKNSLIEAMCQLAEEIEKENKSKTNDTEALEFAEWIAQYQYERDKDGLWRYWDNGIGEHTTKELFNLFKKEQNER